MEILSFRLAAGLGCLAAFGALGFAYVLEYGFGLEPCPLCVFQRIAMLAAGLVFLAAAVHSPATRAGQWTYGVLGLMAAGGGAAIAGRHVWLQSIPPEQVPACGPGLSYLLDVMPWREVMARVLRGDASCASIDASFIGLSLPAWTLTGFVALALWAVVTASRSENKR